MCSFVATKATSASTSVQFTCQVRLCCAMSRARTTLQNHWLCFFQIVTFVCDFLLIQTQSETTLRHKTSLTEDTHASQQRQVRVSSGASALWFLAALLNICCSMRRDHVAYLNRTVNLVLLCPASRAKAAGRWTFLRTSFASFFFTLFNVFFHVFTFFLCFQTFVFL